MNILGVTLILTSSFFYSLRYSFLKDLGKHPLSNSSINIFYRLITIPIFLVIFLISKETLLSIRPEFIFWLGIAVFLGVIVGYYQVWIYRKHSFSTIESLTFLDILFTTITGFVFLNETLNFKQSLGISFITVTFLIFFIFNKRKQKIEIPLEVTFYYVLIAILNLVNRQAIFFSSPIIYTFLVTPGIIFATGLLVAGKKEKLYKLQSRSTNQLLILVGLLATISYISLNYGYKFLPIGIVSALLSLKTFVSLWISHYKYHENHIIPKLAISLLAFVGIVIICI